MEFRCIFGLVVCLVCVSIVVEAQGGGGGGGSIGGSNGGVGGGQGRLVSHRQGRQANGPTTTIKTATELNTCESAVADVMFVVDSSGSVRSYNFKKMLDFIRGIVQMFNVGLENIRVGLVRFNSEVIPEFNLEQYTHPESLLEALALVQYTEGTTNMAGALRYIRTHAFNAENGGRTDARKVAVLISDGRSDNRVWTVNEAAACKENNVTLFALGIGSGVDRDELQDVGSDPDSVHVIFFDDFDSLNGTQITIANTVCTYSKLKAPAPYVPPVAPAAQGEPMDGGVIAAIVCGIIMFIIIILSYPGYIMAKRYVFGGKLPKQKKKRPKTAKRPGTGKARPKTGRPGTSRPRTGRPRSGRPGSSKSGSRISDTSSVTSTVTSGGTSLGTAHTHTPLRPGTSRLKRKDSYGSFTTDSDKAPLRRPSHSSESSGSTATGNRPIPAGLERAISMMRRQKTLTQHPAPAGLGAGGAPGPPGPPLPPGMFARSGTTLMRAPGAPGGPGAPRMPPPGMMLQREGTTLAGAPPPTMFFRGPPPPGALQRDGTLIRGPPPPGMMMRREGTMAGGPPPPPGMFRREGTTMAPPPGAMRRASPPAPPPGVMREISSMGSTGPPPPRERKISQQAIPEEAPPTGTASSSGLPPPPPQNKPSSRLGPLPSLGMSRLPPLTVPPFGKGLDEGQLDPKDLATRLQNLDSAPVPTVVGRGRRPDVAEDAV